MGKNARRISADILYNVYKNDAYLNEELKALRKSGDFCNNDIRFVNELVMGVLKNKLRIDYIISKNINIRLKKVSTYILAILECGVYQIMFMDKVPHSAAVNEAVKLTKTKKLQRSSGFVNAVMRSILKNKDSIEYPKDKTEYLSIYYSFPKWLVEKWVNDFGFERATSIIKSLSSKADLFFRVNTLKTDAASLKACLHNSGCEVSVYKNPDFPSLNYMLLCKSVSDIENLNEYKNGLFYVNRSTDKGENPRHLLGYRSVDCYPNCRTNTDAALGYIVSVCANLTCCINYCCITVCICVHKPPACASAAIFKTHSTLFN